MNISDAIQILRKHNISGASVLRITGGKVTERELLEQILNACDQFMTEREEYKRLLKAAVEDFHNVLTSQIKITNYTLCEKCKYYLYCNCKDKCLARYDLKQWRYADEALKLIGGSENG